MELSYCERGHYAEKMSSGRCKECISEDNEHLVEDIIPKLRIKSRKNQWHEHRNSSLTEDNFDFKIKERNNSARKRYRKSGKDEIGNFSPEEIKLLIDKQNNECVACFTSFDDVAFEIDHKHAVGLYSDNDIKNLQLLCKSCNSSKGEYSNDVFMSEVRYKQVMQYLFELQEEESYAT